MRGKYLQYIKEHQFENSVFKLYKRQVFQGCPMTRINTHTKKNWDY